MNNMNQKQSFEKVPDFINNNPIKSPPEKVVIKRLVRDDVESQKKDETITDVEIKNEGLSFIDNLMQPSTLKIDQSMMLVDFETYKGDLGNIFMELTELYQNINIWTQDSTFKINEYFLEKDFNEIINKIAYLPNNPYLPNIIEIIASLIENGAIELGSIIDTEIKFQNLKRIYNHRVQLILLPMLLYIYNLDRKLMPVKQEAWSVLNKKGRFSEASLLMNDIQKSNIRIRKAQELLTQEKYDLETKVKENIDLLMLLSGKKSILFPVYYSYKESLNNPEFNFEKYFLSTYNIDKMPLKPFSQQLLIYKAGDIGQKVSGQIILWGGSDLSPQFREYLNNILAEIFESFTDTDIDLKVYSLYIRDIVFSITDIAKKRGWDISEVIKNTFISILSSANILDRNDLRVVAYSVSSQILAGTLKIKYKNEEALLGLAKSIVSLYDDFAKKEIFTDNINRKIISEAVYNAIWDTSIEMYPNLITVEKNMDLFANNLKVELKNFKNNL